jgi:ABC-type dipeptide/oligopeptide/nickel transport system permease component
MSTRFSSSSAPQRRSVHPLLKRLLWGLVTLWGVSVITFLLLFVLPRLGRGRLVKEDDATELQKTLKQYDPATLTMAATIAGAHADEQNIRNIIRERKLDRPLLTQYVWFIRDALTNNLKSYRNNDRVMSAIARRFPPLWL